MVILELMSSLWLSYGCPFGESHLFLGVSACADCNGGKLGRYEAASDFRFPLWYILVRVVHTGQSGYSGQSGQTGQELMDLQDL